VHNTFTHRIFCYTWCMQVSSDAVTLVTSREDIASLLKLGTQIYCHATVVAPLCYTTR
jgi:hypothetical protein